jgi:hypothetical protein
MSEEISVEKNDKQTFWSMHIQRCKESNLKQAAYCNQAGINYGSFAKWKSVLFPKSKIEKNKSFIPIKIDATQSVQIIPPQTIQIKLVTGHIVCLPTTMDTKRIAELINYLSTSHA